MNTFWNAFSTNLTSELIAFALMVLWQLGRYLIRPRVRLEYSTPHAFAYDLPPRDDIPAVLIFTQTLRIENTGSATAHDIEIVHTGRPFRFKIVPAYEYTDNTNAEAWHFIRVPSLLPKSGFSIEMIGLGGQVPALHAVRCTEVNGIYRERWWTPKLKPWQIWLLVSFLFVGAFFILSVLVRLILLFFGVMEVQ